MVQVGCSATSVTSYQSVLRNIPEEWSGGSLITLTPVFLQLPVRNCV